MDHILPTNKYNLIVSVLFFVFLFTVCWIYSLGWTGSWHFDDSANLNSLAIIFQNGQLNQSDAINFVLAGDAGPLGRPLSLLSFLIDGSSYSYGPSAMLYTNTLLHLLNGVLVFALCFYIGRIQELAESKTLWIAFFVSFFWLASPLLASSSLMVVQRMTVLSSTFMLLGSVGYLYFRQQLSSYPTKSMLFMGLSLGLGTLLGIFSKEQAIMLPTLIWILEVHLLPKAQFNDNKQTLWFSFKALCFYLPTFFIITYLTNNIIRSGGVYSGREFDMAERLWTEAVILWDYIKLVFFPRSLAFGPFHDDYPIYSFDLKSLLAALSWLIALGLAWAVRKKNPLLLFAVLWFLAAHLIESSVIGLELYFEHRNYIAIFGPLYVLVAVIANHVPAKQFKLATALLATYGLLQLGVLFQTTSLFGRPDLSAELWYIEHPNSTRATLHLAGEYDKSGDPFTALKILDEAAEKQKKVAAFHLLGLQVACFLNRDIDSLQTRYQQVVTSLLETPNSFAIFDTLGKLENLYHLGACHNFLTSNILRDLALTALQNPIIASSAKVNANLHIYIAMLYRHEGNLEGSMQHLISALEVTPTVPILGLAVGLLHSAELYKEAEDVLNQFPPVLPNNPLLKKNMEGEWGKLQELTRARLYSTQ